jgi:aminoglycoside 6'-N-acetyltransferase
MVMDDISFRRVSRADFGLIASWLAEPHVHRWWAHEFTPEAVERDFGPSVDGDEPSEDHLALLDGTPFGLVQFYSLASYPDDVAELGKYTEVPEGAVSIDYFIGNPSLVGHGVGTAMIRAFLDRIWQTEPAATCVIVPVNSANAASWGALLAAGFRLVARGDLEPDNPIDDPRHEILRLDRPIL